MADNPGSTLYAQEMRLGTLGGFGRLYLMQAVDSVTGALYRWTAVSADHDGVGYPGPNAPTETAVAAQI